MQIKTKIKTEVVSIKHGTTTLNGHLFSKKESNDPRPAVIVCHAWAGCDTFARDAAERMVDLGYVGFAADFYGGGRVGTTKEENASLMQPLIDNRGLLRERLLTTFDTVRELREVDAKSRGCDWILFWWIVCSRFGTHRLHTCGNHQFSWATHTC